MKKLLRWLVDVGEFVLLLMMVGLLCALAWAKGEPQPFEMDSDGW